MDARRERVGSLLTLRVGERALVKPFDWPCLRQIFEDHSPVLVLDMAGAEFVSSLFWQSCIAFDRELRGAGKALVLLHVAERHRMVLSMVEGAGRLAVVADEEELMKRYGATREGDGAPPQGAGPEDGVSAADKNMLWPG